MEGLRIGQIVDCRAGVHRSGGCRPPDLPAMLGANAPRPPLGLAANAQVCREVQGAASPWGVGEAAASPPGGIRIAADCLLLTDYRIAEW